MTVRPDYRKLMRAVEDGDLMDMVQDLLDDAYEEGLADGREAGIEIGKGIEKEKPWPNR